MFLNLGGFPTLEGYLIGVLILGGILLFGVKAPFHELRQASFRGSFAWMAGNVDHDEQVSMGAISAAFSFFVGQ